MLHSTTAAKPIAIFLSLWTSLPGLVDAADLTATASAPAATAFVPSCAQGCFQAFLNNNEFLDICGLAPSLQCLCSRYGTTGAALGEGAVQCMVAEKNLGACASSEVDSSIVSGAYSVCNTVPNFASPTQRTIVATVIVATRTATPLSSLSSSTTSSVQVTSSTTPFPTTLVTASRPPGQEVTQTLTNTPPPVATTSSSSSNQSSSPVNGGQVAGITIGGVAALFLLVGLIFFARRARKKRLDNGAASSRTTYQGDGGGGPGAGGAFAKFRDSWSRGGSKNSQSSSRQHSMQISGPLNIYAGGEQWAARPYETISAGTEPVRSEAAVYGDRSRIGIALSPENRPDRSFNPENPGAPRHAAAAVPTRQPSLQLTPQQQKQKQFPQQQRTPPGAKPSLSLAIPTPANGLPAAQRDSMVTEFAEDGEDSDEVAGGAQIWRPPANDPQSATTYYVADKWGNWRRKSRLNGPRPADLDEPSAPPKEGDSGQYGTGGVQSTTSPASAKVAPLNLSRRQNQQPAGLGSPIKLGGAGGGGQQRGGADEMSASSSVYSAYSPPQSIHPGSDNPIPPFPKAAYAKMLQMNQENANTANRKSVSPVSPGVSPVSYPKIPRRDQQQQQRQKQQPQQQYDDPRSAVHNTLFPPRRLERTPPGQPSPTLGAVVPARPPPGQQTTMAPISRAMGRSLTSARPPPLAPVDRGIVDDYGDNEKINPYSDRPGPNTARQQQQPLRSPASPESYSSTASSLLAKRLGAEKAAALSLGTTEGDFAGARTGWKRQQQQQQTESVMVPGMGPVPLPATPGWQPKLTPTRRGGDLFLKVG